MNLINKQHKEILRFNCDTNNVDLPNVILLGERHSVNYPVENDILQNRAIIEKCALLGYEIFLEQPKNTQIDPKKEPRLNHIDAKIKIFGWDDPATSHLFREIRELFEKITELIHSNKNEKERLEDFKKAYQKKDYIIDVTLNRLFFSSNFNLFYFAKHLHQYNMKMAEKTFYRRQISLVNSLKENGSKKLIIAGLAHLVKPKFVFQTKGIEILHNYLKESKLSSIILKPIKQFNRV